MRALRTTTSAIAVIGLMLGLQVGASAQSIEPSEFEATLSIGESLTIDKTITLAESGATSVDLFFLGDNTGSMYDEIANAKSGASSILGELPSTGYRFGVGAYNEDPSEGYASPEPYIQNQALTSDKSLAQDGIDEWNASGGGDFPEANFYALKQVSETEDWRAGAQRLVVWFGDAPSHTATTTQAEAISALQAANAKVVAFNSSDPGFGLDESDQAQEIVDAVGGSLTHNFDGISTSAFVDAVNSQISEATTTLDLDFYSTFTGSGLDIDFRCTDVDGCTGVEAGESRDFAVDITANEVGEYDFEVSALGIEASEFDRISVVEGGEVVPEPASMILLATGLLGVGVVYRRREEDGKEATA